MTVHTLPALEDNYIYILANSAGKCAVIDPGDSEPVAAFLKRTGASLTDIFCTHHHWDHVDGVAKLQAATGCEVWSSEYDASRIPNVTKTLIDQQKFKLWDIEVEAFSIPGHTLGHTAFYFKSLNAVFTGDTVFSAGCGRLFEGTFEQMFMSLAKIKMLPAQTQIYFAHEYTASNLKFVKSQLAKGLKLTCAIADADLESYEDSVSKLRRENRPTSPTSVAKEKMINPFFAAATVAEFQTWRDARNQWRPPGI